MKKLLLVATLLIGLLSSNAKAAITVTPATGGTNICANLAASGTTPGYTSLTTITISEGVNTDIQTGFPRTITITAPAGWTFNTGSAPTVAFTAGRNIVFANINGFTATTFNVNLFVTGTNQLDVITIAGLQVRANTGGTANGNIRATTFAGFNGVSGVTNFGSLSQTPSLVPAVAISRVPAGAICSGTSVTFTANPTNGGAPTYQWRVNGTPVPGATNNTFASSTLANGNNVSVVMNATGCVAPTSANANVTMTVNPIPAAVTVTGGGTFCNNTTLNASLAGAGTIYYQGTTFNGTSIATPSNTAFITTPGTFTYYFRAQAAGCWGPQGSASVSINVSPSAITVSPTSATTLCLGDSATFVASSTALDVEVFQEDFNAGAAGWTITNISGTPASFWQPTNPPGRSNATPGDGTQYLQSAPDATGSGVTTTTYAASPSFSLVGYSAATLRFNQFYVIWGADIDVNVEYSIDGGGSWAPILTQVGVPEGTNTWSPTTPTTTVAMPAPALGQPNVQIRFNYNSVWGFYWSVDNIRVTATPILTYSWVGVSGAAGLSCTTCDTVTITPAIAGVNVYTVATTLAGCTTVAGVTVTVNPLPSLFTVTGGGSYCAGGTGLSVGLSGSEVGVDYQLYNGAATVGAALAGTGAALDFGLQTAAGTYSVSASNATSTCSENMTGTVDIVVNPVPNFYTVTGGGGYCVSDTGVHIGLSGSDTGISYQLWNGITPIGSPIAGTGAALDFGLFTTPATYNIIATNNITGCTSNMSSSAVVTANPLPLVYNVIGGGSYCAGDAGVIVGLDSSEVGVDYQLYNGAVAVGAVVAGTGAIFDFGFQTAAGTYTVLATNGTTGCISAMNDSAIVSINPLPAAITGTASVCEGSTTLLGSSPAGGVWSSSDITVATVDTASGMVTGVMTGVANITYALPTSCFVITSVTVNSLPLVAPIAGFTNLCLGDTTTLTNDTLGGVWTSNDVTVATIDAATGWLVTMSAGITTISYTVTDGLGCSNSATIEDTVTAYPVVAAIGGPSVVCIGSSVTLTNDTTGGVWSSSDATVGAIDPSTGVLSGVDTGMVTISYTVTTYPGCATTVTASETVSPLPVVAPITGDSVVCAGLSTMLMSATTGGTWSSSDVSIAVVSSTGVFTGVTFGSATITYTVTNSAGCSDHVSYSVTVGNAMPALALLPAGSVVSLCNGNPVNLVLAGGAGLTYQWSEGGVALAGATNHSYIASTPGVYEITVDNGTCHTTLPSKTVVPDPNAVISYNTSGDYLYTGTFTTYQWFRNGVEIAGATSSIYTSPIAGEYIVVVFDAGGCTDTSAPYIIAPATVIGSDINVKIKVYPNPTAATIYIDAPIKISVTVTAPDGRVVTENKETNSIDVARLANGMYMLLIYDENKTLLKTERFSKIN